MLFTFFIKDIHYLVLYPLSHSALLYILYFLSTVKNLFRKFLMKHFSSGYMALYTVSNCLSGTTFPRIVFPIHSQLQ